jgi:hypothetical protein
MGLRARFISTRIEIEQALLRRKAGAEFITAL